MKAAGDTPTWVPLKHDDALDIDTLRSALAEANIPTLLMVLTQLSDERWLGPRYRVTRAKGVTDNDTGGLPEEVQAEVRDAALSYIVSWHDGSIQADPCTDPQRLTRMMSACVRDDVDADFAPLILEEMGLASRVGPHTARATQVPDDSFGVLVIGAGISGICAGIKLGEAGFRYTIAEKNVSLGGTWFENKYPGAGVDTPSHLYSYSFAQSADWSRYYAKQAEIREYLESCALNHDVHRHIEFGTTVQECAYSSTDHMWEVLLAKPNGEVEHRRFRVVISAVGQLNVPKIPSFPGLSQFDGEAFHSARWRHDVSLEGKRVAVIGTGASAMQIVPKIAAEVNELLIFQNSPQWAGPVDNYFREVSAATRYLMRTVPFYSGWYRFRLFWLFNDRVHRSLQIDPDWHGEHNTINSTNHAHRALFVKHIEAEIGDRTELLPMVVPDYPPFGKRMLIDNGWFRTLGEPNVRLIPQGVASITRTGVVDAAGQEHEADVLVLSTGFESLRLIDSMSVTGRSGKTLRETWGDDDGRAFLGISVPDFPNFFCLYGPNTNLGHGGSLFFQAECQVRYVVDLLHAMVQRQLVEVEVRREVFDDYVSRVDEAHSKMIWTHPSVDTWYRNEHGRVVTNTPWRQIDYWRMTRQAHLQDYLIRAGEDDLIPTETATLRA